MCINKLETLILDGPENGEAYTMKRQWGFAHIMTKKTMKHALADVGFIFIAYNLRRLITLIGLKALITLFSPFITLISMIMVELTRLQPYTINQHYFLLPIRKSLN